RGCHLFASSHCPVDPGCCLGRCLTSVSTFRPALRSARAVDPAPRSGRSPPPPARDAGSVTGARSRAGAQVPCFSFRHNRVGTDVQHPCGVTNATGVHGHLDHLLFDLRRLPCIAVLQQERATGTALLSAAVPLFALTGLPMADYVGPLTVGTVE